MKGQQSTVWLRLTIVSALALMLSVALHQSQTRHQVPLQAQLETFYDCSAYPDCSTLESWQTGLCRVDPDYKPANTPAGYPTCAEYCDSKNILSVDCCIGGYTGTLSCGYNPVVEEDPCEEEDAPAPQPEPEPAPIPEIPLEDEPQGWCCVDDNQGSYPTTSCIEDSFYYGPPYYTTQAECQIVADANSQNETSWHEDVGSCMAAREQKCGASDFCGNFCVQGAGRAQANGTYTYSNNGTWKNKNNYLMEHFHLPEISSIAYTYRLFNDIGTMLYKSGVDPKISGAGNTCPVEEIYEWTVIQSAAAPEPTVIPGACPTPTPPVNTALPELNVDIRLSQDALNGTVSAGGSVDAFITITNTSTNGLLWTENIEVISYGNWDPDTSNSLLSYQSSTPGASCMNSGGDAVCTIPPSSFEQLGGSPSVLNPGESIAFTVTFLVEDILCDLADQTFFVMAGLLSTDADTSNNFVFDFPDYDLDSCNLPLKPCLEIVEKTIEPQKESYEVGDEVTYSIRVRNPRTTVYDPQLQAGAKEITIEDFSNKNVSLRSIDDTQQNGFSCEGGITGFSCSVTAPFQPGEEKVISIPAVIGGLFGEPNICTGEDIINTAQTVQNGTVLNKKQSIEQMCAVTTPPVTISKTGPEAAAPGDSVAFTISITNTDENQTATNVVVSDELVEGAPFDSYTLTGCPSGSTLPCTFSSISPNTSQDITITAVLANDETACVDTLTNTATVTVDGENEATDTAELTVECADISVTKTITSPADQESHPGGDLAYDVYIKNIGTATAEEVKLVEAPEEGITITKLESCTNGDVLTDCEIGTLQPGEDKTIKVTAKMAKKKEVCEAAILDNIVSVETTSLESDYENNSVAESVAILCPDIIVETEFVEGTALRGGKDALTITVKNIGDYKAENVVLTTDPDAPLTLDSDELTPCSGNIFVSPCALGEILDGAERNVYLDANVGADAVCDAELELRTNVKTDTPESDEENNDNTNSLLVACATDVGACCMANPQGGGNICSLQNETSISRTECLAADGIWRSDAASCTNLLPDCFPSFEITKTTDPVVTKYEPGDTVKYDVTVKNISSLPYRTETSPRNIRVQDILPEQVEKISFTNNANNNVGTYEIDDPNATGTIGSSSCNFSTKNKRIYVDCALPSVNGGGSVPFTITAEIDDDAACGVGTLYNQASVYRQRSSGMESLDSDETRHNLCEGDWELSKEIVQYETVCTDDKSKRCTYKGKKDTFQQNDKVQFRITLTRKNTDYTGGETLYIYDELPLDAILLYSTAKQLPLGTATTPVDATIDGRTCTVQNTSNKNPSLQCTLTESFIEKDSPITLEFWSILKTPAECKSLEDSVNIAQLQSYDEEAAEYTVLAEDSEGYFLNCVRYIWSILGTQQTNKPDTSNPKNIPNDENNNPDTSNPKNIPNNETNKPVTPSVPTTPEQPTVPPTKNIWFIPSRSGIMDWIQNLLGNSPSQNSENNESKVYFIGN